MIDIKKIAVGLLLLIILVIVIFSIVGTTSTDLISSADSVTDANNCSTGTDSTGTPLIYNISDKTCGNSTDGGLYTAGQYDLPLNSLFGSSSVLILIFMVVILFISIGAVFVTLKKK